MGRFRIPFRIPGTEPRPLRERSLCSQPDFPSMLGVPGFPGGNQMVPGGNQKTKEILELEPGLFIITIESCQINRIAANWAGL